ncbi:hypothetical protein [Streptomyces sp. NPDC058657]|uniref:DUF7848 domain-containing protein n=1 Tax=unclassified Streptomyces TaxID=2593676 RepID=UPI00364CE0A4
MSTRSVMRYVTYKLHQDESAEPEYESVCVTGEDSDCGATSRRCAGLDDLGAWQVDHAKQTGHTRFRNALAQYVVLAPVDGSACTVVPTRSGAGS